MYSNYVSKRIANLLSLRTFYMHAYVPAPEDTDDP